MNMDTHISCSLLPLSFWYNLCLHPSPPPDFLLASKLKIWWFPRIWGTILGVPKIRIIVYWGLYWGSFILGNYHINQKPQLRRSCIAALLKAKGITMEYAGTIQGSFM